MSYTDPAGIVLVKGASSCKTGTEVNLDIWIVKTNQQNFDVSLGFWVT